MRERPRRLARYSPAHGTIPAALEHFDALPDCANVRQPVVEALFGCSSATVWRRVQDGGIPPPRKVSARITAWNVGDLRRALRQAPIANLGRKRGPQ